MTMPKPIHRRAQGSKVTIIDGKVILPYGLDQDGLELICDEAISCYRMMVADRLEPSVSLQNMQRSAKDNAHEDAIVTATNIVMTALEKRDE